MLEAAPVAQGVPGACPIAEDIQDTMRDQSSQACSTSTLVGIVSGSQVTPPDCEDDQQELRRVVSLPCLTGKSAAKHVTGSASMASYVEEHEETCAAQRTSFRASKMSSVEPEKDGMFDPTASTGDWDHATLSKETDLELKGNESVDKGRLRIAQKTIIRDKVTYTFCCFLMCLLAFFLFSPGKDMQFVCTHAATYVTLVAWRYWTYQKTKNQFFLLDICYWVNWLVLIWAFFFRKETWIFVGLYSMSFGLVLHGVYIFRNSIVPHSIDKLTSCYVHIMPSVVMFKFRWDSSPDFGVCVPKDMYASMFVETNCPGMSELDLLWFLYVVPYLVHFAQAAVGSVFDVFIPKAYLTANRLVLTKPREPLTIFVTNTSRWWKRCCPCVPGGFIRAVTSHVGYHIAFGFPMIPVYILFRSFYISGLMLMTMMLLAAWNGATFYLDTFVVRYAAVHSHYYNKSRLRKGLLRTVGTQCHHQMVQPDDFA